MKLAIVYAGQGSQKVGMGRDFYEKYPSFRARCWTGPGAGFDVKELCFEGPEERALSDPLHPALHGGLRHGRHRPAF